MELTCNRCHQSVPADSCYCPACGLPQLVYSAEGDGAVPPTTERWPEPVRDASSIDWKPGLRAALALAVPAGLLSSGISPLSPLGIFWMAGAAAGAVVLYMRSQRPAWITMGAGARIGLVTGLIAGWVTFGVSGIWLFIQRVVLHQSGQIDSVYTAFLDAFRAESSRINGKHVDRRRGPVAGDARADPGMADISRGPRGDLGDFHRIQLRVPCAVCRRWRRPGRAYPGAETASRSLR